MPVMVCWYWILKLQPRFMSGDIEGARSAPRKAEEFQTLLGELQDATVSAKFLATISADKDGETDGFTYGILMANELHRAAEIRAGLSK